LVDIVRLFIYASNFIDKKRVLPNNIPDSPDVVKPFVLPDNYSQYERLVIFSGLTPFKVIDEIHDAQQNPSQ
jgi:hypothetical protein